MQSGAIPDGTKHKSENLSVDRKSHDECLLDAWMLAVMSLVEFEGRSVQSESGQSLVQMSAQDLSKCQAKG